MMNWKLIDSRYPSVLDKASMPLDEWRKARTIELYSYLPQTSLEERFKYTDIRDAVIDLNYKFFGYIASHHYIANNYVTYEDKLQSAISHFCEIWHKFMYAAKYRTDLSFAVFFKPRLTEEMEREMNEVKYSIRRSLTMEAGAQLGKHWTQVTYEDLKDVNLPENKMASLQAVFGALYTADLDTHAMFMSSPQDKIEGSYVSDNYNSLTEMLMHEMVVQEKDLDDNDLKKLANLLDLPFEKLKDLYPTAKQKLYDELHLVNEINEVFC